MKSDKEIQKIIDELCSKKIFNFIENYSGIFYDEPKFFLCNAILNYKKIYSDGEIPKINLNSTGVSALSIQDALIKCLGEAIERYGLCCYRNEDLCFFSTNDLVRKKVDCLDPTIYVPNLNINQTKFGWVTGKNLLKNIPSFIPAQLVFLNYKKLKKEPSLAHTISTGAAGDFNPLQAKIKGIYEIVERDAFMTTYLLKNAAPMVNLKQIKDRTIRFILESYYRYKLTVYLFDITNDLKIPSFLTILIDQTKQGPILTLGIKANFDINKAIIGSLLEAFSPRPWIRQKIMQKKINLKRVIKNTYITSFSERIAFWNHPQKIFLLNFLLNQKPKNIQFVKPINNPYQEFTLIKKIFDINHYDIYHYKLKLDFLTKINYYVYKTIIPQLQPLYLTEKNKPIRLTRLKKVAKYFGLKKFSINSIPHPFL